MEGVSDCREWPPPPPALVLLVGGCNEDTFSISLSWGVEGMGDPSRVAVWQYTASPSHLDPTVQI